tara:strand:+ start:4992 stop:5135 length:144 start_codon:yes stop_codon:yes gene_type:complete
MLGIRGFYGGAMVGLTVGVTLGLVNMFTEQATGTGWVNWAVSRAGGQ